MHASVASTDGGFAFREIADGVVVAVARPGVHPDCNAVLVDLGGEVLVVDAHARRSSAEAVAAFAARRFDAPITTVVDTHHHWDHWQGNRAYTAREGVRVLAHPSAIAAVRSGGRASIADQRALLPALRQQAADEEQAGLDAYAADLDALDEALARDDGSPGTARAAGIPGVAVDDAIVVAGDRREVRIAHLGHAHTAGDLVVEIPDAAAIATGDCVVGWTPFLRDADPDSWVRVLDRLAEGPATQLLMGHGEPADGTWLGAFRAYLADLIAVTGAAYADGERGESLVDAVRDELRPAHEAPMDSGAPAGRRWSVRMAANVARVEAILATGRSVE